MINKETYRLMEEALKKQYFKIGGEARLSQKSLAVLLGVSLPTLEQLKEKRALSGYTLLRMRALIQRIKEGLEEGWLPCGTFRGEAQVDAVKKILEE